MQTRLRLLFTEAGADVTEDILPDVLDFSFTDNESEEADEISLTLKDPTGKWAGTWKPKGGEIIRASILNGTVTWPGRRLDCGKFYADSLSAAGNPRTMTIKGVSIPLNKPIRKKVKSKAWEDTTLYMIAVDIVEEAEMSVKFDVEAGSIPRYDRVEQKRESDLKFLLRLCEEAGFSMKVTDDTIYIFDQASYEKKTPIQTLELGKSAIVSWGFEANQSETYKSVTLAFRDPNLKKVGEAGGYSTDETIEKDESGEKRNRAVWKYTYTDPEADEEGQEFGYKTRAKSLDEARRKAKAKLRELNKRYITGNMTLVGDVRLIAGAVVAVKGFGSFDGNFIISKATHTVGTSGYTTSLDLRRVNTNY
ncbi:MAG: phage late control D family protein [Candidatus Spyradenecus sp.]